MSPDHGLYGPGSVMAEVDKAGQRVRRVHASLTGTDADGSVIRLDEPELLTWVHCGERARRGNSAGPPEVGKEFR